MGHCMKQFFGVILRVHYGKFLLMALQAAAQEGDTAPPALEDVVDLHFVALVNQNNRLVELDGRKSFPIDHGKTTDSTLLQVSCPSVSMHFLGYWGAAALLEVHGDFVEASFIANQMSFVFKLLFVLVAAANCENCASAAMAWLQLALLLYVVVSRRSATVVVAAGFSPSIEEVHGKC